MKRNKIIAIIASACSLSLCVAFSLFKSISVNADGEDYSRPITNNSLKSYESNIPDEWYDASKNYGSNTLVSVGINYAGCDLISIDGQTNYAKMPYVTIVVGETLDFYFEMGFYGWNPAYYNMTYSFSLETNRALVKEEIQPVIGLTITQEYGDTTNTLFDGSASYYDSADDFADDDPKNKPYLPSDSELGGFYESGYFHLPKFSIEGLNPGFFLLSIDYGPDDEFFGEHYLELPIFVVESVDNPAVYLPFNVANNSDEIFYFADDIDFDTDYATYALPIDVCSTYIFPSTYYDCIPTLPDTEIICEVTTKDKNVIMSNNQAYFKKPGWYSFHAKYSLPYNDMTIVFFDGDFGIFAYDETSFEIVNGGYYSRNFSLTEENVVDTNFEFYLELKDPLTCFDSYFIVDKDTDDEMIAYDYMSLNEGQHTITAVITNEQYQDFIDRFTEGGDTACDGKSEMILVYNIGVYTENELYPTPVFSVDNDENVNLLDLSYFYDCLELENYEELIAKGASISYSVNYCNWRELGNYYGGIPRFEVFGEGCFGYNYLMVQATYPNEKTKYAYLDYYVNSDGINFAITKNKISINKNAEGYLDMGYYDSDHTYYPLSVLLDTMMYEECPYIDVDIYSEKKLISEFSFNDRGQLMLWTGGNSGVENDIVQIKMGDTILAAFNLQVTVIDENSEVVNVALNFEQGESIRVLLDDTGTSELAIPYPYDQYRFSWFSLNSNIVSVDPSQDGTKARLTARGVGTTEVIAIYQNSDGFNIIIRSTVCIIDEIPDVSINFTKSNDESGFTVYDLINFSVNSGGFTFSNSATYEWYLDDEKLTLGLDSNGGNIAIQDATNNFYLKLNEGVHELKVKVHDSFYNINVEGTRQINIGTVANQEMVLSFNDEEIFMVISGGSCELSVLLDGVINDDFNYMWSIDDSTVAKIYYNGTSTATIIPTGKGETTIVAFANVGKYEDRIIRAEIKLVIEDLKNFAFEYENEFPKPDEDIIAHVIVNGKKNCRNLNNVIYSVKLGEDDVEFENLGNKIIIHSSVAGKYKISASYNDVTASTSVRSTNFNFKKIFLKVLPYGLGILVLLVVAFTLLKINDNPVKNALRASNQLQKSMDDAIEFAKTNESVEEAVKQYKILHKKTTKLLNVMNYYHDEGVDEFAYPLKQLIVLEKELRALVEYGNTVPLENANSSFETMNTTIVVPAAKMVEQAVNSKINYDNGLRQKNIDEAKAYRASAKHRLSFDLFKKKKTERDYLYETGILNKEKSEESGDDSQ